MRNPDLHTVLRSRSSVNQFQGFESFRGKVEIYGKAYNSLRQQVCGVIQEVPVVHLFLDLFPKIISLLVGKLPVFHLETLVLKI